jgi:hypothetical protein
MAEAVALLVPWSLWAARLAAALVLTRAIGAAMERRARIMSQQQEAARAKRTVVCPYCGKEFASRSIYAHIVGKHTERTEGQAHPTPPPTVASPAPPEAEEAQDPPEEEACPASTDGWHDWRALNPAIPAHYKAMALGYREYCRHCEELWAPGEEAGNAPE